MVAEVASNFSPVKEERERERGKVLTMGEWGH